MTISCFRTFFFIQSYIFNFIFIFILNTFFFTCIFTSKEIKYTKINAKIEDIGLTEELKKQKKQEYILLLYTAQDN